MATSSLVPTVSPTPILTPTPTTPATIGSTVPTAGNPFIPAATTPTSNSSVPGASAATVPIAGLTTAGSSLDAQLQDIYGTGEGSALNALLDSIGGTNSATLQEYSQSLIPQEATAQANLDASLGAGGVSSNSSVAAIGNANLQEQELSMVAGEDAQLTQSGQNLEASVLEGIEPAAIAEVADDNPLNVIGQALGMAGSVAGDVMGLGSITGGFGGAFGGGMSSGAVPSSVPLTNQGYGSNGALTLGGVV